MCSGVGPGGGFGMKVLGPDLMYPSGVVDPLSATLYLVPPGDCLPPPGEILEPPGVRLPPPGDVAKFL